MEGAEDIFLNARALSDQGERAAYLSEACHGNVALLERVQSLLQDAAQADAFFGARNGMTEGADGLIEGPGALIGRYKLLPKIGEGGWASCTWPSKASPW